MLLPIVLGKVSCVPENALCELYGVKFEKEPRETHEVVTQFLKDEHA